jgi:hypothetical protein
LLVQELRELSLITLTEREVETHVETVLPNAKRKINVHTLKKLKVNKSCSDAFKQKKHRQPDFIV